jgi:integrase
VTAEDARPPHAAGQARPPLLHLLGSTRLRRSEACALMLADIDERRRGPGPTTGERDHGLDVVVGERPLRGLPSNGAELREFG